MSKCVRDLPYLERVRNAPVSLGEKERERRILVERGSFSQRSFQRKGGRVERDEKRGGCRCWNTARKFFFFSMFCPWLFVPHLAFCDKCKRIRWRVI